MEREDFDRVVMKACPFCGHVPDPMDYDCIYPVVKDKSVWQAGCIATAGGCTAHVLGISAEDAILIWNTRVGD